MPPLGRRLQIRGIHNGLEALGQELLGDGQDAVLIICLAPCKLSDKERAHGSLGDKVGNGNELVRMRVDIGEVPGAGRLVLNLEGVDENSGVVLLDKVLDVRRVAVVGTIERILCS